MTANTYTGNTIVDAGTLALTANGTALASPNFIVNPGATLALDNFGTYAMPTTGGNTNAGTLASPPSTCDARAPAVPRASR